MHGDPGVQFGPGSTRRGEDTAAHQIVYGAAEQGVGAGLVVGWVPWSQGDGTVSAEHHLEKIGMGQGELHVGPTSRLEPVDGQIRGALAGPGGIHGAPHPLGQLLETVRSDGAQQVGLVAEVPVGGVGRDSYLAGGSTQTELAESVVLNEAHGREDQRVAQIPVVVGVLRHRHALHVDSVNTMSKVHVVNIPASNRRPTSRSAHEPREPDRADHRFQWRNR